MAQTLPDLSGLPVLDRKGTLGRLKGDKEFLLTLYQVFIDDLPGKLSAIRASLDQGDLDKIQRAAHSLKGASATIGAVTLREVALALETASRDGNNAQALALLPMLEQQAKLALSGLRSALPG